MWIALGSDRHSTLELSDVADRLLKERIQRLPGVGQVIIGGERRYAMRVWLDPMRLASRGLSVQDVERAIRVENAEMPSGRVEGTGREFAVRTDAANWTRPRDSGRSSSQAVATTSCAWTRWPRSRSAPRTSAR
jgi:multidrug efflux pump subunit AcrB